MKVLLVALVLPMMVQAQTGIVSGTVTDSESGDVLAGANVVIEGTTLGAAADADGNYSISNVAAGTVTVSASVIGYEDGSQTVNLTEGGTATVNFALAPSAIMLSGLEILADRATRATAVAYSNIDKEDMELRLGSRDIPMVLNMTPSVYATAQGGGAGDARVNVRGFNQRNIAIMINGVPVNDMENAWVYWSNWDGVGDATASIQMQRGLSNVNLATPSVGGTMNIITDPTALASGGNFRQEIGSWGFLKSTLNYNTGLINDKMAFSATIVRKTGDGYYLGTWTDAWAYYFGASYALSDKDRLELYAVGAPQRHGQNLYKQNIASYSQDYAKGLDGYDSGGLDKFAEAGDGRAYNENYNTVSSSYTGKQYWSMYGVRDGVERFDAGILNERENYFHKPQVNLNWYHTFSDQMRVSSIFYFSGGKGGGTGTYGSMVWDYNGPSRIVNWDATIARNDTNATGSRGILRNSVNQQWTLGAISKLSLDVSDKLKTTFGIDWRTAEIGHWREVRDLLGGEYYRYTGNDFDVTDTDYQKGLGDKIAYNYTNTVDWLGFFGQGEFISGPISAYGMGGYSIIGYTFT
ncbi:MAG: TonB-dependent receptor, partial [Candidatus Marinimicrobia bacterium]|nr:TonB-dependent receptor [Candidatus Neomarinimicrobiota bacterium]